MPTFSFTVENFLSALYLVASIKLLDRSTALQNDDDQLPTPEDFGVKDGYMLNPALFGQNKIVYTFDGSRRYGDTLITPLNGKIDSGVDRIAKILDLKGPFKDGDKCEIATVIPRYELSAPKDGYIVSGVKAADGKIAPAHKDLMLLKTTGTCRKFQLIGGSVVSTEKTPEAMSFNERFPGDPFAPNRIISNLNPEETSRFVADKVMPFLKAAATGFSDLYGNAFYDKKTGKVAFPDLNTFATPSIADIYVNMMTFYQINPEESKNVAFVKELNKQMGDFLQSDDWDMAKELKLEFFKDRGSQWFHKDHEAGFKNVEAATRAINKVFDTQGLQGLYGAVSDYLTNPNYYPLVRGYSADKEGGVNVHISMLGDYLNPDIHRMLVSSGKSLGVSSKGQNFLLSHDKMHEVFPFLADPEVDRGPAELTEDQKDKLFNSKNELTTKSERPASQASNPKLEGLDAKSKPFRGRGG